MNIHFPDGGQASLREDQSAMSLGWEVDQDVGQAMCSRHVEL